MCGILGQSHNILLVVHTTADECTSTIKVYLYAAHLLSKFLQLKIESIHLKAVSESLIQLNGTVAETSATNLLHVNAP